MTIKSVLYKGERIVKSLNQAPQTGPRQIPCALSVRPDVGLMWIAGSQYD